MKEMYITLIYMSVALAIYYTVRHFDKKGKIDKFFNKIAPSYRERN